MANLKLALTFSDGSTACAELNAQWPSDESRVVYGGVIERLPKELTREVARPNLLEYHWREHAKHIGAKIDVTQTGEWLPEDDLKPAGFKTLHL